MRGLDDTVDTYGPARAGLYVAFLKLFPNLFKVTGSGPGLRAFKADPPPPRPPAQEAGSSTDRAPRAAEVDPRAAYRRFPNELRVEYQNENPARRNSERYKRYENYKTARTIGEARILGATSQDISLDFTAGAVRII